MSSGLGLGLGLGSGLGLRLGLELGLDLFEVVALRGEEREILFSLLLPTICSERITGLFLFFSFKAHVGG